MKIAYDAQLVLGRGGIERYSRELIKGIARANADFQLTLVTGKGSGLDTAAYFAPYSNIEIDPCIVHERLLGAPLRTLVRNVQRMQLTRAVRSHDLVHVLGPTKFLPKKSPLVVTIHDLFPMDPSMGLGSSMQRRFPGRIIRQLRSCSAVVCPSTYVAGTIRDTFPWYKGPIHVTPLAAGSDFVPTPLSEEVRRKHGIGYNYLLFIGRIDPRKNIPRILEAWNQLPHGVRSESQLVLLLAGGESSLKLLQHQYESVLKDPGIRLVYQVPTPDMIQILSNARALVFATMGEGFGLPVVEGMKCGCPVIAANNTSLPEVGGDAVEYVDPRSVDDIAGAMQRCIEDDAHVTLLRQRGLARAEKFTWEETARLTSDVYRAVVG